MIVAKILRHITVCLLLGTPILFAYSLDMDGDGVANAEDVCPFYVNADQRFSGTVGCSDADGDGFEDVFRDECPELAGEDQGCPEVAVEALTPVGNGVAVRSCDPAMECCGGVVEAASLEEGDILFLMVGDGPTAGTTPIISDPIIVE